MFCMNFRDEIIFIPFLLLLKFILGNKINSYIRVVDFFVYIVKINDNNYVSGNILYMMIKILLFLRERRYLLVVKILLLKRICIMNIMMLVKDIV